MVYISQNVLRSRDSRLFVHQFDDSDIDELLSTLLEDDTPHLGISLQFSAEGHVEAVALATTNEAFYISLQGSARGENAPTADKRVLKGPGKTGPASTIKTPHITTLITTRLNKVLAGFSMAKIALHLHRDQGWNVSGIDLSTLLVSTGERPLYPSDFIDKISEPSPNKRQINTQWYPDNYGDEGEYEYEYENMCKASLRAWISAVCAAANPGAMASAKRINTARNGLRSDHLSCLENMVLCAELLDMQKPIRVENDFKGIMSDSEGLLLENSRFTTRVRKSKQTSVEFHTESGPSMIGQATSANGKTTKIQLMQGQYRSDITRVTVHGREELTCAENARDEYVLRILQGDIKLINRPMVDLVWFPSADSPTRKPQQLSFPSNTAFSKLNESQKEVAAAMISPLQPIVITHGPPGTGKTSTIAAAADYWNKENEPTYIIAQSNVGVKNIARSFFDKGLTDFKIIVSKEFYVEWHEYLYEDIVHNLVRSDDLSSLKDVYATERLVSGSKIILCTLSTLSNPALESCQMFKVVPMMKLVVDEASQINVFEFMHLFHKFKDLQKVCFFGDPKQLPPFGRDTVSQLRSIFDVKHLKSGSYFLNTQYRMPVPLGEFISQKVYDSKLKSVHKNRDPSSVAFIDVGKGVEERAGKSWKNVDEAQIVAKLVDRYRYTDYCVITPYDAQRATIVKVLENANLPTDKVFNVDSFQGHEADYVIVSTTRTTSPGFLRTQSRTNVMLTRCKAGMIIVSNSFFVSRCAERTLLGKLAAHWEGPRNSTKIWIDWRQVSEGSVDLPGSRAPHPRPKKSQSARVPPPSRSVAPPPVANLEPSQLISGTLNSSSTISGFSTSSTPSGSSPRPTSSTASPPVAKPFDTRRLFGSIDSIEATGNYSVPSTPSTSSLQSLPEQMSRLSMRRQSSNKPKPRRVDDPDFPEIPNLDPPTSQRPLQGQWRQGSKPVRLG